MYIRFGEIVPKSVNFLKLTEEDWEGITMLEEQGYSLHEAVEAIHPSAFEAGLSVFMMGSDGKVVCENDDLVIDYLARLDKPAYIVDGKVIGKGVDGEPLLVNVNVISEYHVDIANVIGEYCIPIGKVSFDGFRVSFDTVFYKGVKYRRTKK